MWRKPSDGKVNTEGYAMLKNGQLLSDVGQIETICSLWMLSVLDRVQNR